MNLPPSLRWTHYYHKQFKKDFPALEKAGIFDSEHNNWKRTKTSLAEYFTWIYDAFENNIPYTPTPGGFWCPIETSIKVKGVPLKRGSLTKNLDKRKRKGIASKNFTEIKKIVLAYREKKRKEKQDAIEAKKMFRVIKTILREYYRDPQNKKSSTIVLDTLEKIKNALKLR